MIIKKAKEIACIRKQKSITCQIPSLTLIRTKSISKAPTTRSSLSLDPKKRTQMEDNSHTRNMCDACDQPLECETELF